MNKLEELQRNILTHQINRLMVKVHRLRKTVETHKQMGNTPMQKACLVKMRRIEATIRKMENMLAERVQFT